MCHNNNLRLNCTNNGIIDTNTDVFRNNVLDCVHQGRRPGIGDRRRRIFSTCVNQVFIDGKLQVYSNYFVTGTGVKNNAWVRHGRLSLLYSPIVRSSARGRR